jgi:hypothetical protein
MHIFEKYEIIIQEIKFIEGTIIKSCHPRESGDLIIVENCISYFYREVPRQT